MASLTIPSQSPLTFHRRISVRASTADVSPPSAMTMNSKNLYEVLQLKKNASQTEIKMAYRTLAHPDATSRFMDSSIATSSDGGDFIEIHNAYATLSDPDARSVYDWTLDVNLRRRWNTGDVSGFRNSGRGFYSTRRWETDQCW